ncbi:hypothetical protein HDU98_002952 [Podochytrium sp. JEL0797]|nr:hypothetical protein HDU98_002952 [Podochytrium sp. JEL0797]
MTSQDKETKRRSQRAASSATPSTVAPDNAPIAATPALPEDPSKTVNGACAELVSKRLRNLKRRLEKLEKYESLPHKDLEKDQIDALTKKGEVASSVKELEEVVKALALAEVEEIKANKEKARLAKMTEDLKVATAVMEAQSVAREHMKKTMELTFALSTILPNASLINVRLTDAQFGALSDLRTLVLGAFPVADTKTFFESAEHVVSQYLCASTSEFSRGVTYAELNSLIQNIVSPPPMPQFGISAMMMDQNQNGGYDQQQQQQNDSTVRSHTPNRAISFFAE